MKRIKRQAVTVAAASFGFALVLSACSAPPSDDPSATPDGDREIAEGCEAYADYGDLSGKTVTVYTAIAAPEDEPHMASYEPFEKCTGAKVEYEGSTEFTTQLPVRLQAGNAPDIAYFGQPGLIEQAVKDYPDLVVPAPQGVQDNVAEFYTEDWANYASVDGTLYGTPVGASAKSLVWYSPKAFQDNGYEIPKTWDELMNLTKQIADDHGDDIVKPWCVGIGAGEATGWPATDWVEDAVLRTAGPEAYDKWVDGELAFNSPEVTEAMDTIAEIVKNPDYVNGGFGDVSTIATTEFSEAGFPILDGDCFLHRQASFYQANWASAKDDVVVAEDGDVFAFYLPAMEEDQIRLIGGGDFAVAFAERPEVQALQTYLSSPEWVNAMAKAAPSGWASSHSGLDVANLASPIDKLAVELLADESAEFRFDGSDLMPSSVGTGTFWTELVSWFANDKPTDAVLDAITDSWPN